MGKFKELDTERKELKRRMVDMMCVQYPFLHYFIQQAFDLGDEENVYNLIFALETDKPVC